MAELKRQFKVLSASAGQVSGVHEVDGEPAQYTKPAVIVELGSSKKEDGTLKLVLTGKDTVLGGVKEGAIVDVTFSFN